MSTSDTVVPDAPGCTMVGSPDEDADGVVDACDNCIVTPNPSQANVGEIEAGNAADALGDACDPRPAESGDRIGLVALDMGASDVQPFGTYSYPGNGALRMGSTDPDGVGGANYEVFRPITRLEMKLRPVETANLDRWAGIWYYNAPGGLGVFAHGVYNPPQTSAVFWIKQQQPAMDTFSDGFDVAPPFVAPQDYTITVDTERVTGGAHRMTTRRSDGQQGTVMLAISIPPTTSGFIEAYRMIVDVAYFVVYTE